MAQSEIMQFAKVLAIMIFICLFIMTLSPARECAVVVFVDDFSPSYSIGEQRELIEILTKYDTKATLFVIPNHNLDFPISQDPEFAGLLLESGLPLGMHGYRHYLGREGKEFQFLSEEEAGEAIDLGNQEFRTAFGQEAGIFRAPNKLISRAGQKALEKRGIRDASFAIAHEYTWYLEEEDLKTALKDARWDFQRDCAARGHYILTAHVHAANLPPSPEFLDEFLGEISRGNHNFVELESFLAKT